MSFPFNCKYLHLRGAMKLLFISLGCDKNLVDSEYMIGMLANDGIEMTDDETQADIIIVNSCCFIGDAKEESINTILEMAQYKETGKCKSLIVTGCLAQRYKDEIFKEIPEVDAILGTNSYDTIVEAVHETLEKHRYSNLHTLEGLPSIKTKRIVTTGGHFAYLKIAEGCNKNCTYCVIPSVRGRYRSVPMEDILRDARALAAKGIKEINNEILNDDEREQRIMKLVDSLQIPKNNYCCKMRIMTYVDLYNVVK